MMESIKPTRRIDSKNELTLIYNINYFYKKFSRSNKYIDSLDYRFKKQKVLTFAQYKLIIRTYFKIYFYELFYGDKPLYFCLTGKLMKARVTPFTLVQKNIKISAAITALWYNKLLRTLNTQCKIRLLNSSTGKFAAMRQEYSKNNDLGLLPMISKKKQEFIKKKLIYQHDDKRIIFFQPNP